MATRPSVVRVYLIDDHTLQALDKLEDVPVEYRRETIETPFGTRMDLSLSRQQ